VDRIGLWIRWSWRDLRARWIQVLAIAAIIAIGTGLYSGLSSTSAWRRTSYDRSYETLDAHDVKVELSSGTYAEEGRLAAVIESVSDRVSVSAIVERLSVPTQVDASTATRTILVSGRIIGADLDDAIPPVDRVAAIEGRPLDERDDGELVGILDIHFARHYSLPTSGSIRVGADTKVTYVGQGETPEQFLVLTDSGSLFAEASFAVVHTSLRTAQTVSGRTGDVSEVVIRLDDATDRTAAVATISEAFTELTPDLAVEVTSLDDDRVRKYLYDDIRSDQRFYAIFATLVLAGAGFAAFNLTGRMIEAQRRELGIGMALGVEPSTLVIRPLLVALQVSIIGVVLGTGFGLVINGLMRGLLESFVPLPVWRTEFQPGIFFTGAGLGLTLPFAAALWPVLRAVRVAPVDALRTGHLAATGGGLAPLLRRVRLPGDSINQMPLRDALRAPRRTIFTMLGIATAVATLISVMGMVDTFLSTIDRGKHEILAGHPQRMTVELDSFYPLGSQTTDLVQHAASVETVVPALQLGATVSSAASGEKFDLFVTMLDFTNPLWVPTAVRGDVSGAARGIVLSEKASRDLHVDVGGIVTLRHPRREGTTGYRMVETQWPVAAIHPNPYRFVSFIDLRYADSMNMTGIVNLFQVTPKPDATTETVQRELFGHHGVAGVQPVTEVVDAISDFIGSILDVLNVVRGAVLLLVVLIAFNSSSISVDERRRQHATMFAFGLPVRRVMLLSMIESMFIGVLGTVAGIALGFGILQWIVHAMLPETVPELGIITDISSRTVLTAALLGVVAVAIAPLFTMRRLVRTRIPDQLRVVE
jgi:putative ABC transport system permease protein